MPKLHQTSGVHTAWRKDRDGDV